MSGSRSSRRELARPAKPVKKPEAEAQPERQLDLGRVIARFRGRLGELDADLQLAYAQIDQLADDLKHTLDTVDEQAALIVDLEAEVVDLRGRDSEPAATVSEAAPFDEPEAAA